MDKITIKGLDEIVVHEKLENGLNIYVVKKDYNTFSCYFITNFGALIDNFIPINEDKMHKFPKGVAHFLEHKMFEMEKGPSVMERFSKMGITCNAFTNYDFTAYYINGVDNLKDGLNFLIDYVQSPYFTEENVEKEKGIINEERLMTLDNPYRTFGMKIIDNIFVNYEYGKTIVGEKEDIYNITKEDLYRCYNTFYNPSNMSLIVVSNENEEDIINLVKENQSKKKFLKQEKIQIKEPKEVDRVNKEYDVIYDNVTKKQISYSIKFNLSKIDLDSDKLGIYFRILLTTNFSKLSEFNLNLKNKKLIDQNINYSASKYKDYAIISIVVSGDNEDEIIDHIKNKFNNLDLSEDKFNLIKRNMISESVYDFTTTNSIMGYLYSDYYEHKKITEDSFIKVKEINYEEYKNIISNLNFNNVSITIMKPNNDKE